MTPYFSRFLALALAASLAAQPAGAARVTPSTPKTASAGGTSAAGVAPGTRIPLPVISAPGSLAPLGQTPSAAPGAPQAADSPAPAAAPQPLAPQMTIGGATLKPLTAPGGGPKSKVSGDPAENAAPPGLRESVFKPVTEALENVPDAALGSSGDAHAAALAVERAMTGEEGAAGGGAALGGESRATPARQGLKPSGEGVDSGTPSEPAPPEPSAGAAAEGPSALERLVGFLIESFRLGAPLEVPAELDVPGLNRELAEKARGASEGFSKKAQEVLARARQGRQEASALEALRAEAAVYLAAIRILFDQISKPPAPAEVEAMKDMMSRQVDALGEQVERIGRQAAARRGLPGEEEPAPALDKEAPGAPQAALEPVDVEGLLRDIVARQGEGGPSLTLRVEPGAGLTALARVSMVRSAVENLVSNVARYGGGRADVSVGRDPDDAGRVRVSVRDYGRGVPPAEREKIGNEYLFQSEAIKHAEGTGVGLYSVHQGLLRLGSGLRVGGEGQGRAEDLGKGAVISFSLPAAEASRPDPAAAGPAPGPVTLEEAVGHLVANWTPGAPLALAGLSAAGSHPLVGPLWGLLDRLNAQQGALDAKAGAVESATEAGPAALAHDLRNPLVPLTYLEPLLKGKPLAAVASQALARLGQAVASLSEMVNRAMLLARLEAPGKPYGPELKAASEGDLRKALEGLAAREQSWLNTRRAVESGADPALAPATRRVSVGNMPAFGARTHLDDLKVLLGALVSLLGREDSADAGDIQLEIRASDARVPGRLSVAGMEESELDARLLARANGLGIRQLGRVLEGLQAQVDAAPTAGGFRVTVILPKI